MPTIACFSGIAIPIYDDNHPPPHVMERIEGLE